MFLLIVPHNNFFRFDGNTVGLIVAPSRMARSKLSKYKIKKQKFNQSIFSFLIYFLPGSLVTVPS
jgi:hypothetical protein